MNACSGSPAIFSCGRSRKPGRVAPSCASCYAGARRNRVGGPTASERNLLSGSLQTGLQLSGAGTPENLVQGKLHRAATRRSHGSAQDQRRRPDRLRRPSQRAFRVADRAPRPHHRKRGCARVVRGCGRPPLLGRKIARSPNFDGVERQPPRHRRRANAGRSRGDRGTAALLSSARRLLKRSDPPDARRPSRFRPRRPRGAACRAPAARSPARARLRPPY